MIARWGGGGARKSGLGTEGEVKDRRPLSPGSPSWYWIRSSSQGMRAAAEERPHGPRPLAGQPPVARVAIGLLLTLSLVAGAAAQESPSPEETPEEVLEEMEAGEAREETSEGAIVGALAARFRPFFEGRVYRLRVNLHKPEPGGRPAPWMDAKGWHRRDTARPVILGAGERVQVTGVFDYGDRSIFIELTRWPSPPWDEEAVRTRIRLKADSGPEKADRQDQEIRRLLAQVIEESPLPTP